jgi:hypothetical protein
MIILNGHCSIITEYFVNIMSTLVDSERMHNLISFVLFDLIANNSAKVCLEMLIRSQKGSGKKVNRFVNDL